jgi:hypothetical protein
MQRRQGHAPSYRQLRPIKGTDETFPVYKDLVGDLLRVERAHYDPVAAHACAVAAGWAYADHGTMATMLARLGLGENRYFLASTYNDAMFIASNAFIVQSECGRVVILCYRGTEPRNFINWLTDADVSPMQLPFPVGSDTRAELSVHGGFYRNFRETWYEVVTRLKRAAEGLSILEAPVGGKVRRVQRLEALYVTGHSLGAAMAALAAVRLVTDPDYRKDFGGPLRGVYTFGQPMVGDRPFAAACDDVEFLRDGVFRHVFAHDVVPSLPPAVSGSFAHFGRELRASEGGRWQPVATSTGQIRGGVLAALVFPALAFVVRLLAVTRGVTFPYSWYDHAPTFYIDASRPEPVESEFQAKAPTAAEPKRPASVA